VSDTWLVRFGGTPPTLCVASRQSPRAVETGGCTLLFDGAPSTGDVENAYARWGELAPVHLRGAFVLIIWDAAHDRLLCARDHVGLHPLFYAHVNDQLFISPSLDTLVAHPEVPSELNRAALADHLAGHWPRSDETYFAQVKRLPAGHALQLDRTGLHAVRYWDPIPPHIEWLPDGRALEEFESRFSVAVERAFGRGPAAIFLSGGLDSVSVAATCVEQRLPLALALSRTFPGESFDEEITQRAVARELDLPQLLLSFEEAARSHGALAAALAMSRCLPAPLVRFWRPAYQRLAVEARQRGCRVILTGEGGDDWVELKSSLAADCLRHGDLTTLYRLWRSQVRFYPFGPWALLRELVWDYGARLLLREPGVPSFYARELRESLEDPRTALDLEEFFVIGRSVGLSFAHPFWDPDLIESLVRTSPRILSANGATKGLLRTRLARRFPTLGFDRQRRAFAMPAFDASMHAEAEAAYRQLGGFDALDALGLLNAATAHVFVTGTLTQPHRRGWARLYNLLNLETWVRSHVSPSTSPPKR
jgi:asparagine synthetase B (glutamine-hydrolysing)